MAIKKQNKVKTGTKITTTTINKKDIVKVQSQYQNLPYPLRNPDDEAKRLLSIVGESLPELNHWLYKGKQDFKSGFRVLIAGGGTGDSSTFLAEQLKHTDAEIVYLDFSQASMEIAKKRAQIRGLKNITFILDSILNIPKLKLGKFDFINCSGVLHHLASPDEGLQILANSLAQQGGMHLMVYAKYGRMGLYHIQDIMKMINNDVEDIDSEIKNAKILLQSLPTSNWFARAQELLQDHNAFGDIGIYDMFLHKQDRAYTVPQIYDFVENVGLHFVDFAVAESRLLLKPESYIKDHNLLAKVKNKDIKTQQAICELMVGKIIKHDFFVSAQSDSIASIADLDNVPYFHYNTGNVPHDIYNYIENNKLTAGANINFNLKSPAIADAMVNLSISDCTKHIFKGLTFESKTLREIFDYLRKELNVDIADQILIQEMQITLKPFFETGILFLRDKSIERFCDYSVL